jgi:hypothetical protein
MRRRKGKRKNVRKIIRIKRGIQIYLYNEEYHLLGYNAV